MLKRNTNEGYTSGTIITNSLATAVTPASGDAYALSARGPNSTLLWTNEAPTKGSIGIKFQNVSGENSTLVLGGISSTKVAIQIDGLRIPAGSLPTDAGMTLVQFWTGTGAGGATRIGGIDITTAGRIALTGNTGNYMILSSTTQVLPQDSSSILVDYDVSIDPNNASGATVKARFSWPNNAGFELTVLGTGNMGVDPITAIRFLHPSTGGIMNGPMFADNLAINDTGGYITPLTPGAPTVSAGGNKTINAGTTTTLNGSATPSSGSITSYAWTKESGPAVTLGGSDTATLTVNSAPAGHYTFKLQVADSSGGVSSDTMNLFVATPTARPDILVSTSTDWLPVGGAQSIPSALADEVDSTGIQSPDNPTGSVIEYFIQPLQAGDVSVSYRASKTATTPARALKTELYMGSTLIASQTLSDTELSTVLTTYTLTLTSAQVSSVTNRNDLRLRHTAS